MPKIFFDFAFCGFSGCSRSYLTALYVIYHKYKEFAMVLDTFYKKLGKIYCRGYSSDYS
jgi:hypothetical protein